MAATFENTDTAFTQDELGPASCQGQARGERRRRAAKFSPELLADLARSGLEAVDAEAMQLEDLAPDETFEMTGQRRQSYKIPFFDIAGGRIDFFESDSSTRATQTVSRLPSLSAIGNPLALRHTITTRP